MEKELRLLLCETCDGTGKIWDSMFGTEQVPCDQCNGTGIINNSEGD